MVLPRSKFRLHCHVIVVYSRRPDHFVHLMIQNRLFSKTPQKLSQTESHPAKTQLAVLLGARIDLFITSQQRIFGFIL